MIWARVNYLPASMSVAERGELRVLGSCELFIGRYAAGLALL